MNAKELIRPPKSRIGQRLTCYWIDRARLVPVKESVKIAGYRETPAGPWPTCRSDSASGQPGRIMLTGTLVDAVRQCDAKEVARAMGVTRYTVARWRRALGVERMNPGTTKLWQRLAPARLSADARRRGGKAVQRARKAKRKGVRRAG